VRVSCEIAGQKNTAGQIVFEKNTAGQIVLIEASAHSFVVIPVISSSWSAYFTEGVLSPVHQAETV
jgi:hypothetical protein